MEPVSIISFTAQGMLLSKQIAAILPEETVHVFTKYSGYHTAFSADTDVEYVTENIRDWAGKQMREKRMLLFVGACGIAVRAIAPFVSDKLCDSPILVVDELGGYVIPILSGHVGGANAWARQIAEGIGATAILTTATDINQRFAVDVFAAQNHLHIVNREGIARISSRILDGETITIAIEKGHWDNTRPAPPQVRIEEYVPGSKADVCVTTDAAACELLLQPRQYVIGIGCRKGKEEQAIADFIQCSLHALGIQTSEVYALASIVQKKDEAGLLAWSRKYGIPFYTYTTDELQAVAGEFTSSDFVKSQVGVDNVCERAAWKVSGPAGQPCMGKRAENGMTLAIVKKEWSVSWDGK